MPADSRRNQYTLSFDFVSEAKDDRRQTADGRKKIKQK